MLTFHFGKVLKVWKAHSIVRKEINTSSNNTVLCNHRLHSTVQNGEQLREQLRQLTDGLVANNNRDGSAVNEVIANSWGPAGDLNAYKQWCVLPFAVAKFRAPHCSYSFHVSLLSFTMF